MKIVILGAGALGTVLGAHLARAGEDVTLIARGQRAAYLQEHGATITGLVDFTVPVRVVTDPSQIHNADVLMVTVKTYDMASALASIKHLDVGSVLSIQNGVLKNEQLAQTFGWGRFWVPWQRSAVQCSRQAQFVSRSTRACILASCPQGPQHGSRPWVTP